MHSLTLDCPPDQAELVSAELWDLGACGVQEEDVPVSRTRLRAFFEAPPDLSSLQAYDPLLEEEPETDWAAESLKAWPRRRGRREVLPRAAVERRSRDCRAASGSPSIPAWPSVPAAITATQLCLEALEQYLRPGETVLDLGTGTGILAAAAYLSRRRTRLRLRCRLRLRRIARDNSPPTPSRCRCLQAPPVLSLARGGPRGRQHQRASIIEHSLGDLARLSRRALILSGRG